MARILRFGAIFVFCLGASFSLSAEPPDTRLNDAVKEIAQLKRMTADQDRRIALLERTVRSLQTTLLATARPVTPSWRNAEGWGAVKVGMSRDRVVEILGEPTSTDAVIDRQTLWYKDANQPVGKVVLTDDRVSELDSSRFHINVTSDK